MKCPGCGAEINDGSKFCEFCGTQITVEMQKEREQLNKAGCPKCGSTNVTFNREKQGEVKGKNGSAVVRATVGMCKDCGHTWTVQGDTVKKKRTWIWVLGWIFIFPLPLTILLLRPTNKLNKKVKIAIIAIAWIIYLIWIFGGNSSDKQETAPITTVETPVERETTREAVQETSVKSESHLYDNAEIRDVMNGSRDSKIGEMAVIKASTKECTDEAIADVYYNFYEKNELNWITLIYTDKNDNSGIYFGAAMVGVNDLFETNEYGDYSVISSPDEIIYVPSGDGKTLTKIEYEEDEEEIEAEVEKTVNKEEPTEEVEEKIDNIVDPDLKAFLDSYEAYMDQYIEFMETYDASDTKMLLEYAELMTKYADFADKIDKYNTDEMSAADSAYYLEVVSRVNMKLAKVAYTQ